MNEMIHGLLGDLVANHSGRDHCGQLGMTAFTLEDEARHGQLPTGPLKSLELGGKDYTQARATPMSPRQAPDKPGHGGTQRGAPQLGRGLEWMEIPLARKFGTRRADAVPGAVYQGDYCYGFNGMGGKKRVEAASEVKGKGLSYDFGARVYDPRVGRWWSWDPKSEHYRNSSLYAFGLNSPIFLIDADGNEIYDSNGKKVEISENNGTVSFNPDIAEDTKELLTLLAGSKRGMNELLWMNSTVSKIKIVETDMLVFAYDSRDGSLNQPNGITIVKNNFKLVKDHDGSEVHDEQEIIVSKGSFQGTPGDLSKLSDGGKALVIDEYHRKLEKPKSWIEKKLGDVSVGNESANGDLGVIRKLLTENQLAAIRKQNLLMKTDIMVFLQVVITYEPNHAMPENYGLDANQKEEEPLRAEAELAVARGGKSHSKE